MPVSAAIMMMMRPCLRPLVSDSRGSRRESSKLTRGGFISGGTGEKLACVGSIEIMVNSSDMLVLNLDDWRMKGGKEQGDFPRKSPICTKSRHLQGVRIYYSSLSERYQRITES